MSENAQPEAASTPAPAAREPWSDQVEPIFDDVVARTGIQPETLVAHD